MENKLEQIAKESNYQEYLKRMTASIGQSSKGLIPFLISMYVNKDRYRILDVGCGLGGERIKKAA